MGGVDKGLVVLHGRPLIAWLIESLGDVDEEACVIIANRNIPIYSTFAPTITDRKPNEFGGPLAGIAAALCACRTDWLFTLPVDCLRAPRGLAAMLLDHAIRAGARAAVAHDGLRRQPLFGIYQRDLAESACIALDDGAGAFRWQETIGARELDCSSANFEWLNLNTNEELATMTRSATKHE